MRQKRIYKNKFNLMIYIPIIAIIIGSIVGSLMAISKVESVGSYIDGYMISLTPNSDKAVGFIEAFVKYGKITLCIWVLGFIGAGIYIIPLVLFVRGFSYGFTTVAVFKTLGLKGGLGCVMLYLPQSFLLIPLYVMGALISIQYIKSGKQKNAIDTKLYCVYLMVMLVVILLTGLLEVFAMPLWL